MIQIILIFTTLVSASCVVILSLLLVRKGRLLKSKIKFIDEQDSYYRRIVTNQKSKIDEMQVRLNNAALQRKLDYDKYESTIRGYKGKIQEMKNNYGKESGRKTKK